MSVNIKKGQIFFLSDGCYSDYGVTGHFRALKDFNTANLKPDSSLWPVIMEDYHSKNNIYDLGLFLKNGFTYRMINEGYVEELDVIEVHRGAYSDETGDLF